MSFCQNGKQLGVQELITELAVVDEVERNSNDTANPFCPHDSGSMQALLVPLLLRKRMKAWAMNSDPLSLRMEPSPGRGWSGPPAPSPRPLPCQRRPTRMGRQRRLVDQVEELEPPHIGGGFDLEVHRPYMVHAFSLLTSIRAIGRPDPLRLARRQALKAFFSPEPVHPVVVHHPALPPE